VLSEGLATPHRNKTGSYKMYTGLRIWIHSLKRSGEQKMDMRFETWNVRTV